MFIQKCLFTHISHVSSVPHSPPLEHCARRAQQLLLNASSPKHQTSAIWPLRSAAVAPGAEGADSAAARLRPMALMLREGWCKGSDGIELEAHVGAG